MGVGEAIIYQLHISLNFSNSVKKKEFLTIELHDVDITACDIEIKLKRNP